MTLKQIFDRLGTGERWWAAEILMRLAGLALIAGCVFAGRWLYGSVHTPPPHEAGGLELVAAAVVVTCGLGGTMLAFIGPSMFKQVPIPGGSHFIQTLNEEDRPQFSAGLALDLQPSAGPTIRHVVEFSLGGTIIAILLIYVLTHHGH